MARQKYDQTQNWPREKIVRIVYKNLVNLSFE